MNTSVLLQFTVVKGLQATIAPGEITLTTGVPSLSIDNLPQPAGDATRDAISAALRKSGLSLPQCRVSATLPDHDPRQPAPKPDLAIAVAILIASGQIPAPRKATLYLGNLEADGSISPTPATVTIAMAAQRQGIPVVYAPTANAAEAAIAQDVTVYAMDHLKDLTAHLRGAKTLETCRTTTGAEPPIPPYSEFSAIPAPSEVKRALEIAAAGNLPIMLSGSPGAGRTLLARALPGIMPRLKDEEALECANLRSLAGQNDHETPLSTQPPFRAPHHTISGAGLNGGGRSLKPGELSLSHRGVLFLDPLTDFSPQQQAAVSQALTERAVTVTKLSSAATYPADFLLAAAMQPCHCGYQDATEQACVCTPAAAERHQRRVSEELAAHIALHVSLFPRDSGCQEANTGESSETVRQRVQQAREFRETRRGSETNIAPDASALLQATLHANPAEDHRRRNAMKAARAIADLELSETIRVEHVEEALSYAKPTKRPPAEPSDDKGKKSKPQPSRHRDEERHQIPMALC